MQDGESWASAFLVVVGIEKNDNDLLHYRVSFRQKPENPVSVFRVFDLLYIQLKPYENEFSTALSECKAVARCATRKTDTAINRIKTSDTHKLRIVNTSGRKRNKNHWDLQTVAVSRKTDAICS